MINLSKEILGQNKEPFKEDGKVVTLKHCLIFSLSQSDAAKSIQDAVLLRKLFNKIDSSEKEIEFKSEEIMRLKELAVKALSGVLAGAVILELEPE